VRTDPSIAEVAKPCSSPPRDPSSRLASAKASLVSIDLLRGVAALAVLMFHAQGFFGRDPGISLWDGRAHDLFAAAPSSSVIAYLLFGLGWLGVPLFFVISGFCIHLPYASSQRPLDVRQFAVRRFFRLYPPYLLACLIGLVVAVARTGWGEGAATWPNLIGHLVFWHYSWPIQPAGLEMTIVIWTIVIEVHFYAIYALLLQFMCRVGVLRTAAFALAIGIAYRVAWEWLDPPADTLRLFEPHRFALARFGEWMLGVAIAELYAGGELNWATSGWRRTPSGWTWRCLLLVSIFAAIVAVLGGHSDYLDVPATIAFAILTGGLVACETAGYFDRQGRLRRIGRWLGSRSYSLYLVHLLVLGVSGEVAARALGIDKEASAGSWVWFGVTLVGVAAALLASDLVFRLVENPSHQLARRLTSKSPRSQPVDPSGGVLKVGPRGSTKTRR
jgi:peptidoglycan/LPS O-acetylase OafA/YrhL